MSNLIEIHKHISAYIESKRVEFITDDFAYATYTAPNTMFHISNELPDLMLTLTPATLRVWIKIMSLLKRNHDPVMAITVQLKIEMFKDVVARTKYYAAIKELISKEMIIVTPKKSIYIVNISHANKLFKPKMDL